MRTIYTVLFIIILGSTHIYADEIYLEDKRIIRDKVLKVAAGKIAHDPDDENFFEVVDTKKVAKTVYSYRNDLVYTGTSIHEAEKHNSSQHANKQASTGKNLRHPFIKLGLLCGFGFYGGEIYDKENSLYGKYRDEYELRPDDDDIDEFPHMYFGGYELDLMLPAVVLKTKLGVKGRYMRILGNPVIDDYLFTYSTYQIGPVLNTILKENEWLTISLQYYALYGKIRNGDLNSADYLRNRGVELEKSEYHTTFDGTTYSFGIGPQVLLGDTFKVYFGCSLNYTYAKFEFDKVLPVYGTDHTSYRAVTFEFNAGICL